MGATLRLGMLLVLVLCNAVLRSGCGDQVEIHMERRGVIFSPSWPLNYPAGLNCSWNIQAGHGEIITMSFRVFDVGETGSCESGDWLLMTSSGWGSGAPHSQRLCGSARPPPFITSRGGAWLYFHSKVNGSGQAQGFHMSYIKGHFGQSSCQPDEFLCGNGKCVPRSWKCNDQDECGDATDERGCSPPPSAAPPGPCPRGTLPCAAGRSIRCLATALRCDRFRDCPDGSDELGCPDTSCGKRLGHFYGSFASPDFFRPAVGAAVELRCSWVVDTRDPKPILLRLDLRLGPGDALHVYDGAVQRAENLLQVLSYHNNRRPTLLESSRGQMSVLYTAKPQSPGHGFNATYQVKGYCFPGERPCGNEQGCYSERQRCDGYWHCPSGRDESSCPACPEGEFPCGGDTVGPCYPRSERCNNQKRCPDGSDENNCYDCQPGNFHCGDNLCIFETWRCDGQEDCPDGSDERSCPTAVPRKVITAALIGSLVCGLLLVVALGCALKLHALRGRDYRAFETQMSRMEAEFVQREAPPSYGQLIAQGLIPPVEDFPAYNPTQASVLQNLRLAMSRQLRRHTSRRSSTSSSSSRRRFGHLCRRLFRRGARPRGHVPLLDPPAGTHVNLGLHCYRTAGGDVDAQPSQGHSEGADPLENVSESPASPLSYQSGDSPEGAALSPDAPGPSDASAPPLLAAPSHPRSSRKLILDLALNMKGVSLRRYSPLGPLSPANSLATAALPHPLGNVPPSSSSSSSECDSGSGAAEMRYKEKRKRRRRRKRREGSDPLSRQVTPC
ncbi:low-density lipoprotein receptor-related protein 3 isoform X2 [Hippocampus zosterae]|uniref:low-density lipoprotein receptor-related protein 3 isoform X2 n=1 Tax=Hippocampus zosterae TaxID=109293 RepID=UPI00223CE011|nr:low-density lipoprotein receptor-related protein 3 isoform X2 [Hippocampus zosterae]